MNIFGRIVLIMLKLCMLWAVVLLVMNELTADDKYAVYMLSDIGFWFLLVGIMILFYNKW